MSKHNLSGRKALMANRMRRPKENREIGYLTMGGGMQKFTRKERWQHRKADKEADKEAREYREHLRLG